MRERDAGFRSSKIKSRAENLSGLATLFLIVGGIVGIISLVVVSSGDSALTGFCISGALIGSAFWFYLIAQIIHIRANTEK